MLIHPSAISGYFDASITVRTNNSDCIDRINETERENVFSVARKWADEEMESNKEALKEHCKKSFVRC